MFRLEYGIDLGTSLRAFSYMQVMVLIFPTEFDRVVAAVNYPTEFDHVVANCRVQFSYRI